MEDLRPGKGLEAKKGKMVNIFDYIVLRRPDPKEPTCLLRHITTENSDLCPYMVCITRNTT